MRHNPERLAWSVLLTAFVIFCVAVVGCPISAYSYLLNARKASHVQLNAQRGTVRVERGGSSRVDAVSLSDPEPLALFKGDGVLTGDLTEGLLVLQRGDPDSRETWGQVVIYDNSSVLLRDAYTPRFGISSGPHKAVLEIKEGRVRIEVDPASDGQPVQVEVQTEHARVHLIEGSYALQVSPQQTTAAVRDGEARVYGADQELVLTNEQRAVASSEALEGPLPAEHNLVINGDFEGGVEAEWLVVSTDPSAHVVLADNGGQVVAQFQHDQVQAAEVRLIQILNRNVRDLTSLVLSLKLRVNYQSLSVCGSFGSECPVMVRIDYLDAGGGERHWVHGFYAFDDPNFQDEPAFCHTCPEPLMNHDRVPQGEWFLYESPNLMEMLQEFQPARIQSVRVYASGHQYDSMVTDIALLAQE